MSSKLEQITSPLLLSSPESTLSLPSNAQQIQSDTSGKQKSKHHPPRHVIYNARLPCIQVDGKQKEGDFLSRQGFEDQKQEVAMHYCQYLDPFGKTLTFSRVGSQSVRGYTLKTYTHGRETPRYITLMYYCQRRHWGLLACLAGLAGFSSFGTLM